MSEHPIFYIKMAENDYGVGQLLQRNSKSVICLSIALFEQRSSNISDLKAFDFSMKDCFSTVLVTSDLFDYEWAIEGDDRKASVPKKLYPFRKELSKDAVGVKMINPKVLLSFLHAYHGLLPWDHYHDPLYFEKLLLSDAKRPNGLIFEKS